MGDLYNKEFLMELKPFPFKKVKSLNLNLDKYIRGIIYHPSTSKMNILLTLPSSISAISKE